MAKKDKAKKRPYRRCENCGQKTRSKPVANEFDRKDVLCKNCREEDEGYYEMLQEEAELDPTGPAYYLLTGDESKLRRGYR